MPLTLSAIKEGVQRGLIHISPEALNRETNGPNSVDVTLSPELKVYIMPKDNVIDMKSPPQVKTITIPEEGYVLMPGCLYLGSTNEYAISNGYIPMYEGRSSIGRLGMQSHITAGFGDIGWGYETLPAECEFRDGDIHFDCPEGEGWVLQRMFSSSSSSSFPAFSAVSYSYWCRPLFPTWTLEITVVHPVRVYPNIRIGQVYFEGATGDIKDLYKGKYSNQKEAQPSLSGLDFE